MFMHDVYSSEQIQNTLKPGKANYGYVTIEIIQHRLNRKWVLCTGVLGRNYQKKNVQTKISSESVKVLTRASEKPWFSQFEPALFELFDFEFYLMKSVNRNLRFAVFLVFPKNGPLRRLLGTCLCYDQLFFIYQLHCVRFS